MDIVKEIEKSYYRALHGPLNIPLWFGLVPKDQDPDVFGLISTVTNSANDTISSFHSLYVTQVMLVVRNSIEADKETLRSLASKFRSIVQPEKGKTLIDPIGFQIEYTRTAMDIEQPPYMTSSNEIVCERIIQIENRIYHQ